MRVNPNRSIVRHNVLSAAGVGIASRNSVNVASGRARMSVRLVELVIDMGVAVV